MHLSLQEVSALFAVSENTVHRWVREENLPMQLINGRYKFHRSDLLEWATLRRLEVPPALLKRDANGQTNFSLAAALELGGVSHRLTGADKGAVLRAVVESLPLPGEVDRESLLELLLSREATQSTAIGEGIAIPHPRQPIVLLEGQPLACFCFLSSAIPFDAPDQQPVHTLCLLITPSVRAHLELLAQLAVVLRFPEMRQALNQKAGRDELLSLVRRLEAGLMETATGKGGSQ